MLSLVRLMLLKESFMGTSFYLKKKEDNDGRQLHVCRRSGKSWKFQGVHPSADFVARMGKDTSVYFYADEFKDFLPPDVKAITSVEDWVHVLTNLPEGVELTDNNFSGETAEELVALIHDTTPESLSDVSSRSSHSQDGVLEKISQSMAQDEFVDRHGWRFTFRSFS